MRGRDLTLTAGALITRNTSKQVNVTINIYQIIKLYQKNSSVFVFTNGNTTGCGSGCQVYNKPLVCVFTIFFVFWGNSPVRGMSECTQLDVRFYSRNLATLPKIKVYANANALNWQTCVSSCVPTPIYLLFLIEKKLSSEQLHCTFALKVTLGTLFVLSDQTEQTG